MTANVLLPELNVEKKWNSELGGSGPVQAARKRLPTKAVARRSSGGARKAAGVEKPSPPEPLAASPEQSSAPGGEETQPATMEETLWKGLKKGFSGNVLAEGGERPEPAAAVLGEWAALLRRLGERLASIPPRDRLALAVEQREALAALALEKGDLRVALAAWDSRDKFLGLLDRDPIDESRAAQTLARLMELAARRE